MRHAACLASIFTLCTALVASKVGELNGSDLEDIVEMEEIVRIGRGQFLIILEPPDCRGRCTGYHAGKHDDIGHVNRDIPWLLTERFVNI